MRHRIVAVTLLLLAPTMVNAECDFTRHVYSCTTSGMTFQELASAGVDYVSHVPATPETAREAHRWGVRTMPYVSLYKVVDTSEAPGYRSHPFWREVDLVEHPDWVLIREDGERRRPFNRPDYSVGVHQSCCNQPGIADAYVRGVEAVLETGADGAFVDNVHPYPKCFGPELGIHDHLDPDADNREMYRRALMRVYRAVQAHGDTFAVMLNSGHPRHAYEEFGDSLMWESFIFRHGFPGDEGDLAELRRVDDWAEVRRAYEEWREFIEAGGSMAPYTYLPVKRLEKPHAFLGYACAKLCGFQQWTGSGKARQDVLRQLYRTDTGVPVGPLHETGPVLYREYQRALIAGNSSFTDQVVELPWPVDDPHVVDLYTGEQLMARDGMVRVSLPPDSGRIFVTRAAYLANCIDEAAGMAQSCALRLDELTEEHAADPPQTRHAAAVFREALGQARECRRPADRPVSDDADLTRQVGNLTRALDALEHPAPAEDVNRRLMEGGLPVDELRALLRSDAGASFQVEQGDDGVTLRSAGAVFAFRNDRSGVSIDLAGRGMTLWVSPAGLHGDHGWLHADRIEDVEVAAEGDDVRTVQFVVRLRGSKSQKQIKARDVLVRATIQRGLPGVELDTVLRNHSDESVEKQYWFWNISAGWHTLPDGRTLKPSDWGSPGDVEWDYLHTDQAGGGGLVIADFTGLGWGGGQADIFASPKTQPLPAGGEVPIEWTVWSVPMPWYKDAFLQQRMRWYSRYASLAAEAATGLRLLLDGSEEIVAGAPTTVRLRLAGPGMRAVKEARLELALQSDGRQIPVEAAEAGDRWSEYVVRLPEDGPVGRTVELQATAAVDVQGQTVTLTRLRELRIAAPMEVLDVRQTPVQGTGLGLAWTLRNNMQQPLAVHLDVGGEDLPGAGVDARLAANAEQTVEVQLPEAELPDNALETVVRLTAQFRLPDGSPREITHEESVAVLPMAVCQTAANPPVLDGKLDDSCWQFATRLSNFVHHQTGEPAHEQTVCNLVRDDANMYFGFDCAEEDVEHLRADAQPDADGMNPHVPTDDSIEIYIDPRRPGRGYFRLALNSIGTAKSSAHGGWDVATGVEADRWIVEVRIPFEVIRAVPKPGEIWGLNVCRNDQSSGEATAWSFPRGPYATPERFGGLRFAE